MLVWRVSRHRELDGAGGLRSSARWHTQGRPITYASEHPGTAVLEWLAGLEASLDEAPRTVPFMKIEIPADIVTRELTVDALTENWRRDRAYTRSAGDAWLQSTETAVLIVPCVTLPARNVLINPIHRDAGRIVAIDSPDFPFDPRLAQ